MAPVPEYKQDEETQARIRENIRARTYESALPAIEQGVNDAVSAVRDNKEGGFWGFIKSMIFRFAEMLGFEKTLAKWFGSPIPEKEEQKAVAAQVSDTVSKTLTDPDFKYKNKQEFETGLSTRIQTDLKAKRTDTNMASFSDEQFKEIANKAARATTERIAPELFDAQGNATGRSPYLSTVDAIAKDKVSGALTAMPEADKKNLALLAGTKGIKDTQIDALSIVLGPKMAELEGRKEELKAQGSEAYVTVRNELQSALINNKEYLNTEGNMNMDDAKLAILAGEIGTTFTKGQLGIAEQAPQAFVATSELRKQNLINGTVENAISDKVKATITQQTAQGVYESWQDSWWTAAAYPNDVHALDGYYNKDTKDPKKYNRNSKEADNDGKLAAGEEALFQFAARKGKGLSGKQRDRIAELISESVTGMLNDPAGDAAFKANDKQAVATMLQSRIQKKLENDSLLDSLGTPLKTLDSNMEKPAGSLSSSIASGFADVIRKNEGGAYDQLSEASSALMQSRMKALNQVATDTTPVTGSRIEGLAIDSGFNAPDGSLVGAAGSSPAGDKNVIPKTGRGPNG